jgi:transcription initiation factor IIF auxiliary subunit
MSPLRVRQEARYFGDKYWNWSVWLDGPTAELDQIKFVEYTLDPTFPNPVRRSGDRESQFKLSAGGWGEFIIYAKVIFRDGSQRSIDYPLRLERPVEEPASR